MPDEVNRETGEILSRAEAVTDTVTINPEHLRAVQLFAARKDIRYYLNGVLVHVLDNGAVRLIATNGHVIGITHTPLSEDVEHPRPLQIIVPIEVITLFAEHKGGKTVTILRSPDGGYRMETIGLSVNFAPIDGKFPEYERVVPATTSGRPQQYDPAYIALFAKAAAVYAPKTHMMTIEHNGGEAGALVHLLSGEFIGVLMPWSVTLNVGLPAWITAKPVLAMPVRDEDDDGEATLPGIEPAPPKADKDDGPLATAGDAERLSEGDRKRKCKSAPADAQA